MRRWVLVLSVITSACETPGDSFVVEGTGHIEHAQRDDSGTVVDASTEPIDSGVPDSGTVDSGVPDAGAPPDAGSPPDASVSLTFASAAPFPQRRDHHVSFI